MVKHFIVVNVVSSLAPRQITDYMRLDNSVRTPPFRNEILPVISRLLYKELHSHWDISLVFQDSWKAAF